MNLLELTKTGIYELLLHEELPDIHAEGYMLRHKKSGARIALIPCEDNNKVFNIAFRTPPYDSTGVAHIIEHTVLCGSERYPLKDPFVELAKGSLNTFLNAMTYPDKTLYPVASTNDADFRNLMSVYLDAVFFPNIYHEQNIFRQEGWHYEMESEDSALTINGVVYNEMKGVFSSPDDVLERETMNVLFPDTAYGVESGGDPDVIPTLTYRNYLDFHSKYYHPSNSYIFLYGDMDMAESLHFLDSEYLSRFDAIPVDSALRFQKPFSEMRRVVKSFPISSDEETEKNTYLSWNVVAGDELDLKEMIAMDVLDYALLSAPGAPVKQALLDAGIGLDIYGGFSDGFLQPYYSISAKNSEEAEADRFLQIIRDTLTKEVKNGISSESLKAGLHTMEFSFREADYGLYPKGLYYTLDCLDTWLYNEEMPFDALKQLAVFKELNELIGTGYFESLVEKNLLNNPHSALIILKPETGLQEKRERALAQSLAEKKAAMSAEEIRAVMDETRALRAWQDSEETEEAVASLPVLKRSDLKKEIPVFPNEEVKETVHFENGKERSIPFVYHETECSGIGYLELLFNAKRVPLRLVPYLGLMRAVLINIGTASHTYMELSNAINTTTGGMICSVNSTECVSDPLAYKAFFTVRMKALIAEMDKGASLIREVLYTSLFDDEKRIKEILSQTRSQLQLQLQQAGHGTAATRAAACTSPEGAFTDAVGGIGFYRFIRDLEDHYEEKKGEIRDSLRELAGDLFRSDSLIVSYTCGKEDRASASLAVSKAVLPTDADLPLIGEEDVPVLGRKNEGFTTQGQVQYVAVAGSFLASGIPYSGSMGVARQILNLEYLWQNVRVRGGAYGCSSNMKRNGRAVFVSYRDPHLLRTKEVFEQAAEFLRTFEADEAAMTKYVIGTVSTLDIPLTPSTLGVVSMRAYLSGLTDELRQRYRDEVLRADSAAIRAVADAIEAAVKDACLCVVGGESSVASCKELFDSVEALL